MSEQTTTRGRGALLADEVSAARALLPAGDGVPETAEQAEWFMRGYVAALDVQSITRARALLVEHLSGNGAGVSYEY